MGPNQNSTAGPSGLVILRNTADTHVPSPWSSNWTSIRPRQPPCDAIASPASSPSSVLKCGPATAFVRSCNDDPTRVPGFNPPSPTADHESTFCAEGEGTVTLPPEIGSAGALLVAERDSRTGGANIVPAEFTSTKAVPALPSSPASSRELEQRTTVRRLPHPMSSGPFGTRNTVVPPRRSDPLDLGVADASDPWFSEQISPIGVPEGSVVRAPRFGEVPRSIDN